ncbi:MAG: hypothetical protein IPP66_14560 [Anaerolineales bacterium]|nr:hypothetical protein [Anaerolineales bacterium]
MKKIVLIISAILTLLISACGPSKATPTPFFWAVDELTATSNAPSTATPTPFFWGMDELTATAGAPNNDEPIQAIVFDEPVKGIVNESTPVQGMVNSTPIQAIVVTTTPIVALVNPGVEHKGMCLYDSTNAWYLKNKSTSEMTVNWKFDYLNPSRIDVEGQVKLPAESGFVKVYVSPNKGSFIVPNVLDVASTTCFAVKADSPSSPSSASSDAPAPVAPTACSPTAPGCTQ